MADPIIARELSSLRDEMAAAQRGSAAPPAAGVAAATATAPKAAGGLAPEPSSSSETDYEKQLHDLFGELVDEVTGFLEEAEKNIAAHPTASMVGALAVGILIGSMIRRR